MKKTQTHWGKVIATVTLLFGGAWIVVANAGPLQATLPPESRASLAASGRRMEEAGERFRQAGETYAGFFRAITGTQP
jgi:hypothetical protein